jgi:hypothetical protein
VGLLPGMKNEANEARENKDIAAKEPDDNDDDASADEKKGGGLVTSMVKRVHHKIFRYQRSKRAWIDQEYQPEKMLWRGVIGLEPGTAEYDRVVAEEPVLKEFFNVGRRVVVVWKNKIYRIVGK